MTDRPFRPVVPEDVFDSRRYGFSQAVVVAGGAPTVHVSGQVGWDPERGAAGPTLADQVPVAFENLDRVLRSCGGGLDDVVALRIYVTSAAGDDLASVGEELRRRFTSPPAATWIRVEGLADPSMLVEVEATAALAAAGEADA